MTDPTPDLCCKHGERIDRLVELMEDHVAARKTPKLATGGIVGGCDNSQVHLHGTGCVIPKKWAEKLGMGGVIEPPEGHVPEPIDIDLRHEQIITAEQIRIDPHAKAALDEINREVATDQQGDTQ